MYVRFALVIPERVDELGLNYKNEFEMAKGMSGLNNLEKQIHLFS